MLDCRCNHKKLDLLVKSVVYVHPVTAASSCHVVWDHSAVFPATRVL